MFLIQLNILMLECIVFRKGEIDGGVCVSAITLFMSGFIVDEYSLGGDGQSFCMFIAIGCISGLNFVIYYRRK